MESKPLEKIDEMLCPWCRCLMERTTKHNVYPVLGTFKCGICHVLLRAISTKKMEKEREEELLCGPQGPFYPEGKQFRSNKIHNEK